jgi:26S proteasome regulatory subunit N1
MCKATRVLAVFLLADMQGTGDSVHWIFKNKDHGKTSATASLGLVTLWDVEGGLPQIDK